MKRIILLSLLFSLNSLARNTITNSFRVNADEIVASPFYRLTFDGKSRTMLSVAESFVGKSVSKMFLGDVDSKVSIDITYLKNLDPCMYSVRFETAESGSGYRVDIAMRNPITPTLTEVTECLMKHEKEINRIVLKTTITE